jgi:HSP20 family protein
MKKEVLTMATLPTRRSRTGLERIHDEMDDLIGGFFGGLDWPFSERKAWPSLDIAEDENAFLVTAEIPGVKAEEIDINVHGNMLTISGEKKLEQEKKEKGYYHLERKYGSFRREVALPSDVDSEKIDAAYKNGILSITLPKTEKSKAVKVKVKEQ